MKKKSIKVIKRSLPITENDLGQRRGVHMGKINTYFRVLPDMLGIKFGELAKTRKFKSVIKNKWGKKRK